MTVTQRQDQERTALLHNGQDIDNRGSGSPGSSSSSSTTGHDPETETDKASGSANLLSIILVVSVGIFLAAADQTVVIASYSRIGSDLNALDRTSWVALGYYLTISTFQPMYGRFSDIFGRKNCLLFAYAVFGLGCLFCGLAQSIWQLFAARLWQGVGGGGMTTVVTILLSDLVPLADRGLWQGVINIIFATGAGAGGPIGAAFADSTWGWRWSFFAQVPLCIVAFVGVVKVLDVDDKQDRQGRQDRQNVQRKSIARIDFIGACTLFAAVASFIVGIDQASTVGWSQVTSYVPLAVTPALAAIFVYVETAVSAEPVIPPAVVTRRAALPSYLSSFFAFGANVSQVYFLSLLYQASVVSASAFTTSLLLVPGTIAEVSGTLICGFLLKRAVSLYWINLTGYALLAIGNAIVVLVCPHAKDGIGGLVLGNVVAHVGNGFGIIATLVNLISCSSHETQAVAISSSYLFRTVGAITGLSATTAVVHMALITILNERLGSQHDSEKIVAEVLKSLDYLRQLDSDVALAVRAAYGQAISVAFWIPAALGLCAFGSSVFLPRSASVL